MPVLSDVVLIFFSSIVVLTPRDNFLIVPVLHSISARLSVESHAADGGDTVTNTNS